MYEALKAYFLSVSNHPRILKNFFKNRLSKAYLYHLHSFMSMFHKGIIELQIEQTFTAEMIVTLDNVCFLLRNRLENSFICLKTNEILLNAREEGFDNEADNFVQEAISLHQECLNYLEKWFVIIRLQVI